MLSFSATLSEITTPLPLQVQSGTSLKQALYLMHQSYTSSCRLPEHTIAVSIEKPPIQEALATTRSSYVLVMKDNVLQGILTERDVVRLTAQGTPLSGITVDECMSQPVISLKSSDFRDIFTVLSILRTYRIRHLPINTDTGDLVGIITPESLREVFLPNTIMQKRFVRDVMNRDVMTCEKNLPLNQVAQQMSQSRVSCLLVVADRAAPVPLGIITERDIMQYRLLELDIHRVLAETVMSSPLQTLEESASLWEAHLRMKQYNIRRLVICNETGQLSGLLTQTSLFQALDPVDMVRSVEKLQDRVTELEQERMKLLQQRTIELEQQVIDRTQELQQQAEFDRLINRIAREIRSSLHLDEILRKTVTLIRKHLKVDRVLIYQLSKSSGGHVLSESIVPGHQPLKDKYIYDPCFEKSFQDKYQQGRTSVISDIYTESITPCHRNLLESLEIRSQIVLPILVDDQLWGLMTVSQAQKPRQWEQVECDLLLNLTTHVAIAIQQSNLYEQSQADLAERQKAEAKVRRLNTALEERVEERTSQLNKINHELLQEIQERQKVEAQLHKAQFHLEARVEERTLELQSINSRLKNEISIREQTQQALVQKQNFLSAIMGVADAFVLVMTPEGKIIQANSAWTKLVGEINQEKSQVWQYFADDTAAELFRSAMQAAKNHQASQHLESGIKTQSKTVRDIAWSQTFLEDYNSSDDFVIAIGVDITERNAAENALQLSEQKYSSLFHFCSDCIIVHDLDGNVIDSNRKAREIFGYESNELKKMPLLKLHANQTAEKLKRGMSQIQQQGSMHFEAEFVTKNKGNFYAEVSSAIFEISGKQAIQAIIRDVTERKLSEESLKRINEELESKFERRTIQLIQANRKLHDEINERKQIEKQIKASLKEKETLLKEIHHRVKNNLFVASSLLELQSDHIDDPQVVRFLEDSQNRIYSMALVHEQLYRSHDIERINFGDYLNSLLANLSSTYDRDSKDISFELDSEEVFLNIETANPCGLIVNELISNTLKHAFQGRSEGKVLIQLKNLPEHRVCLRIIDDGVGFPDDLDYRETESLGLQLICSLTEQIEGEISLESHEGTTFSIEFSELQYSQRI